MKQGTKYVTVSEQLPTAGSPCPFCEGRMKLVDSDLVYGT